MPRRHLISIASVLFITLLLGCGTVAPTIALPQGEIAYLDNGDIWIVDLATGVTRQLTTLGTINSTDLSWSQDGQWLAFDMTEPAYPYIRHIWIANGESGATRQVTAGTSDSQYPHFAAASQIVFMRRFGSYTPTDNPSPNLVTPFKLITTTLDGHEIEILDEPDSACAPTAMSFASETRYGITFSCHMRKEFLLTGLNGLSGDVLSDHFSELSRQDYCHETFTWSSGGKVVFAQQSADLLVLANSDCHTPGQQDEQEREGFYVLKVGQPLTTMDLIYRAPAHVHLGHAMWSPDDQAIAFVQHNGQPQTDNGPQYGIWVLDVARHDARQVVSSGYAPAWRP